MNNNFELVVASLINIEKTIETIAEDKNKSEHMSPLDACTCTGNCGE